MKRRNDRKGPVFLALVRQVIDKGAVVNLTNVPKTGPTAVTAHADFERTLQNNITGSDFKLYLRNPPVSVNI